MKKNLALTVSLRSCSRTSPAFISVSTTPGGHNSRIVVRPNSVMMRKDLDKKDPRSHAPVLAETDAALAPDTWHTMLVELNGEELLARIDDAIFLYGTPPGINQEKAKTKTAAGKQ